MVPPLRRHPEFLHGEVEEEKKKIPSYQSTKRQGRYPTLVPPWCAWQAIRETYNLLAFTYIPEMND